MKILQINKFLYPHQGGIESVSESIINALDTSNLNLHNICFSNTKDFKTRIKIKRFYSKFTIFSQPISFKYMAYIYINANKFDACIVHFPNIMALLPLIFINKSKIFIYWHSDIRQQNILLRKFFYFIEKILITKRNTEIIFATPAHEKCSIHDFSKTISHIIPYTLNNQLVSTETYNYRKNHYTPKNKILFIGRLVEYKGIPYLINSMRNIDAKLHIVGTGPLEQELKRMSKDLINVKFLGRVENLEKEFYDASVLILPSINAAEMFGIVQIEAFARGIPVISTSIPNSGVQLVNRDNHTGYTCAACSSKALEETINKFFLNSYKFDSKIIRKEYLSKYSNEKFKENLLKIL